MQIDVYVHRSLRPNYLGKYTYITFGSNVEGLDQFKEYVFVAKATVDFEIPADFERRIAEIEAIQVKAASLKKQYEEQLAKLRPALSNESAGASA